MSKTKIEWSEMSWNPVIGCTKVSAGCQNCYAERMMYRQVCMGAARWENDPDSDERAWVAYSDVMDEDTHKWNGKVSLRYDQLDKPLHWRKPRMIFVCFMGDLFHKDVPFEFINKIALIMARCPQHTFQVLTKRPEIALRHTKNWQKQSGYPSLFGNNVWLGVSVENNDNLWRVNELSKIQAAIRFISFEPLLGEIGKIPLTSCREDDTGLDEFGQHIDWVIIGCESGPKRRECKLEWVRDLIEQCKAANVPVKEITNARQKT